MKLIYTQSGQFAAKASLAIAVAYRKDEEIDGKFGVHIGFKGDSNTVSFGLYSTADRAKTAMDMLVMWLAADNDSKNIFYMPEDGEHLDVMVVEEDNAKEVNS